jgi:hypothetical protein
MNMTLLKFVCITFMIINIAAKIENSEESHTVIELSNSNRFSEFESKMFYNKEDQKSYVSIQNESDIKIKIQEFLKSEHLEKDSCDGRIDPSKPNFYYFFPTTLAILKKEGDFAQFSNRCFKNNKAILQKLSKEQIVITISSTEPKHWFCSDNYWFSSSNIHHLNNIFKKGEHKFTIKNLNQDDLDEISVNGLKIYGFCDGFFTFLDSFFMTLKLYIGGLGKDPNSKIPILKPKVPEYMEKSNIDFLNRFVNFNTQHRGEFGKNILEIDEKEIKTGDFIAIYRLDGLDPLIMYGSGSRIGHSAVAVWINDELYIIESQDGWYWPKRGIQRNKWKQWIEWAHNADFNVAVLPLREEIRNKLDVEKALKWFTSGIEGLPYGYHNFIYSWIDTPTENFPPLVTSDLVLSVFSVLEKISKNTSDTIMTEGLNMRLKTKGLTLPQITAEAARRGVSFAELIATPEIEGWEYHDGKSYVCSCFVVAFWKAGGLFDGLDINSTEFTPKDAYQLDFYDLEYKERRPQACKDADPDLPYCQIIGKYQVKLDGYSSIKPYSHMNEKCSSLPPFYTRPDNC